MENVITGSITISLSKSDASGNYGYFLSFDYKYQEGNTDDGIEYLNIEFSGPGSWDDYSEGDDYPYPQMLAAILNENNL